MGVYEEQLGVERDPVIMAIKDVFICEYMWKHWGDIIEENMKYN